MEEMGNGMEVNLPKEIEKRSFEIITEELGNREFDPLQAPIIKRVIHTTADFEYADTLTFSPHAVEKGMDVLKRGVSIVTDTQMAKAGINKKLLKKYGAEVFCFMADADVAEMAEEQKMTRAAASMEKAAAMNCPLIFAIGNAPTALIRLEHLIRLGKVKPELIIGAAVGFVNVVYSKELILRSDCPHIVAKGRKGGSTVAAAICNALLYSL